MFPVADAYEIEFRRTLDGLASRVAESIRPVDRPPDPASVWCRQFFSELELWWQSCSAVTGRNDTVFRTANYTDLLFDWSSFHCQIFVSVLLVLTFWLQTVKSSSATWAEESGMSIVKNIAKNVHYFLFVFLLLALLQALWFIVINTGLR